MNGLANNNLHIYRSLRTVLEEGSSIFLIFNLGPVTNIEKLIDSCSEVKLSNKIINDYKWCHLIIMHPHLTSNIGKIYGQQNKNLLMIIVSARFVEKTIIHKTISKSLADNNLQ